MKILTDIILEDYTVSKIRYLTVDLDTTQIPACRQFIGFDPGTAHCSFAFVTLAGCQLFEIKMERKPHMWDRQKDLVNIINFLMDTCVPEIYTQAVCEGPSYSQYREAELSEQRATFNWHMNDAYNIPVMIVMPNAVYKKVFGNGRLSAWKVWKELPRNAASALACALFPTNIQWKVKDE